LAIMLGAVFLAGCVWENEEHALYPNITEWEQEDHTLYPNITEMIEPASATSSWTDIRIEKAVDWAKKWLGKNIQKIQVIILNAWGSSRTLIIKLAHPFLAVLERLRMQLEY